MRHLWKRKVTKDFPVTSRKLRNRTGQMVSLALIPAFLREALTQRVGGPSSVPSGKQLTSGPYRACMARTMEEKRAAFRLRFRVFNLELHEGLETAYQTGEDTDEFDLHCDHVLVYDSRSAQVVGTYRLQTGAAAERRIGYYSEREFDFSPYRVLRDELVELGRACIHPDHRTYEVLMLLWKAIAAYARDNHARYLIGCSSLTSQDPLEGSAVYHRLKPMLAEEALRTVPTPEYSFPVAEGDGGLDARPPKLLRTYLALGATICGPPAIDREFKTIDFLTLMDLNNLSPSILSRLLE